MKTKLKNVTKKIKEGGVTLKTKLKNSIKSLIKWLKKIAKITGFLPKILDKYIKGKEDGNSLQQLLFLISEIKSHIQTWITVIAIVIFLYTMFTSGNLELQTIFKLLFDLL